MILETIPKANAGDPARVVVSGVKDGDVFFVQDLLSEAQQANVVSVNVKRRLEVLPVKPATQV